MKIKLDEILKSKKYLLSLLEKKAKENIDQRKKGEATKLLEADKEDDEDVAANNVKIARVKATSKQYLYQFTFMSKRFRVDFSSLDDSNTKYKCTFYVAGFENSPKVTSRFGISSVSTIEPLIEVILRVIKVFVSSKKPIQIRFLPGVGVQFPSSFHMYIFKPLKQFEDEMLHKYSVIRGDSTSDGSAFVLKKGGQSSNLKSAGWRPGKAATKPTDIEPTEEQVGAIANITGDAVQTTIPFRQKKRPVKIERRK